MTVVCDVLVWRSAHTSGLTLAIIVVVACSLGCLQFLELRSHTAIIVSHLAVLLVICVPASWAILRARVPATAVVTREGIRFDPKKRLLPVESLLRWTDMTVRISTNRDSDEETTVTLTHESHGTILLTALGPNEAKLLAAIHHYSHRAHQPRRPTTAR